MLTRKTTSEVIKSPYAKLAPKAEQSSLNKLKPVAAKQASPPIGSTPKSSTAKNIVQKPSSTKTSETNNTEPLKGSKSSKTRLVVKYDAGFNNNLFIRGSGLNLSWDKGVALKNISADEWVWETEAPFSTCEFKVLINDEHYELGENHRIGYHSSIQYSPRF